jgi:hypothetical protein
MKNSFEKCLSWTLSAKSRVEEKVRNRRGFAALGVVAGIVVSLIVPSLVAVVIAIAIFCIWYNCSDGQEVMK